MKLEQTLQPVDDPRSCSQVRRHDCGGGFGVKNKYGIVQFWKQGEWRNLPKREWAWWHVPTRWFGDHYVADIWVPKLLPSSSEQARWYEHPPGAFGCIGRRAIRANSAIKGAPMLFQHLQNVGDERLGRTCRLVCRDWAKEFLVHEPKDWRVKDSVVWHRIETEWQVLPRTCWAWAMQPFSDGWWVEWRHRSRWVPKVVQHVDESVQRNPKFPSTLPLPLSPSGASKRSGFRTAAVLPPELFKYICNAADHESLSCRLVCRYWNRLCTPRVFERIDVKHSPERIRALWRHRKDLSIGHVKVIDNVPDYYGNSKFPWLHRLSQTCTSTQSVWNDWEGVGHIDFNGSLAGGHRTVRSIHFALPRALPRSLSRGIKKLDLWDVDFRQFEDLTRLGCELPDLEELRCTRASFGSLPNELPRRRPRASRNKLRTVAIWNIEKAIPILPSLTLYLSVYDVLSFFSAGDIAVILALLPVLDRLLYDLTVCYEETPCSQSRRLKFMEEFEDHDTRCTILGVHTLRDSTRNTRILVIADFRGVTGDEKIDCWTKFDTEFGKISGQIRQAEYVFGFADREQMVRFAGTVLEAKMPLVYRLAHVRYSIHMGADKDESHPGWWYRASLESENLTGTGEVDLEKVYS